MNWLKNFIGRCEEKSMSFGLWMTGALAIIFIRDSLECIVSVKSFPIVDLFHTLHVPIFFLSLLLAIILVLHFFSGEEIIKVSRISLIFFTIIIFPVAFDFFLSLVSGKEVVYEYIMEGFGKNYLQFFNPFYKMAAIPMSLRVEVAVITLLSFAYIYIKKGKVIISLLGACLIFTLTIFYGSIPAALTNLLVLFFRVLLAVSKYITFNMPAKLRGTVDERIVVLTQLLLSVHLVALWFWRYDPKKWVALFKNLRFNRVLHYAFMVGMGLVLYFYDVRAADMFVVVKIIGIFYALFFACQFSAVTNDIFDQECDRLSNPERPLITGTFCIDEYRRIGWVYLAFALLFAIWVSDTCFMITLLFIVLYFIYSAAPLRLKRFYPFNPLIIGLQAVLVLLLGQLSLVAEETPVFIYQKTLWLIFAIFTLGSHIKDIKDAEGDRSCHIGTLPVLLGERNAKMVTAGFVFLSYLISPLIFSTLFYYNPPLFILALIFGGVSFFHIIGPTTKEKVIFGLYFVYAFILFLFLLKNAFFS